MTNSLLRSALFLLFALLSGCDSLDKLTAEHVDTYPPAKRSDSVLLGTLLHDLRRGDSLQAATMHLYDDCKLIAHVKDYGKHSLELTPVAWGCKNLTGELEEGVLSHMYIDLSRPQHDPTPLIMFVYRPAALPEPLRRVVIAY